MTSVTIASGDAGMWLTLDSIWDDWRVLPRPTPSELGLDALVANASEVEELGRHLGSMLRGSDNLLPPEFRAAVRAQPRWIEVADLLRAIGASSALAATGVRETHGFIQAAETAGGDKARRHADLARAAFVAESTQQYLISVGHQLTAVGLRFALLHTLDSKWSHQSKRFVKAANAVLSGGDGPQSWPFHSEATWFLEAFDGIAPTQATRILFRAEALYETAEWKAMDSARGANFHRLRVDITAADDSARAAARSLHAQALEAATELGRYLGPIYHAALALLPTWDDGAGGRIPILKPVFDVADFHRKPPPNRLTPKRRLARFVP